MGQNSNSRLRFSMSWSALTSPTPCLTAKLIKLAQRKQAISKTGPAMITLRAACARCFLSGRICLRIRGGASRFRVSLLLIMNSHAIGGIAINQKLIPYSNPMTCCQGHSEAMTMSQAMALTSGWRLDFRHD